MASPKRQAQRVRKVKRTPTMLDVIHSLRRDVRVAFSEINARLDYLATKAAAERFIRAAKRIDLDD